MSQVTFNRAPMSFHFLSSLISKGYRLSGVALSAIIPVMLWMVSLSLQSTYRFSEARYWLFHPIGKISVVLASALCLYHSVVSFYVSLHTSRRISVSPLVSNSLILFLTVAFAGGLGYWVW